MAQYNGSIRINTQLNTKEFERDSKGLTSSMKKLGSSLNGVMRSIGFGLGIAGLIALGKQAVSTASDIQEVQNVVDTAFGDMSQKMEDFAKTSVKQFGISQLSAKQTGSVFMAMGKSMVGNMETASNMAISLTGRAADMASFYNKSFEETSTALKAIYTGETEVLKAYGVVMTEVNLQEYAATKGITKKISAMTQAEKVQLRYMYVMEQTALAEGDFVKTSDSWANQTRILSEQFKELLSVLGSGLITVLTPAVKLLNTMLTQLIAITRQIGTLTSKLFGIKMPVSDSQKFANTLSAAAGGADELADGIEDAGKEAKKALAPFDDLYVLSEKSEEEPGGALFDGGFAVPEFESEESEKELGVFESAIDALMAKLKQLKNVFSQGFWDGLGDWKSRLESIKKSAASIKDSLINIWKDPAVLSAQNGYYNSLLYMFGSVAGSFSSIGLTIGTNLIGGLEEYLDENKERIKEFVVSMFDIGAEISQLIAEFSQAFAYVFEAFGSEDAQQLTANLIGIFTDAVMGTIEVVNEWERDILKIFIKPFTENKEEFRTALEGFLGVLSEVAETVKQGVDDTFAKISEVYDEHFKPFFESVAQGLSELVAHFLEFWNTNVQPILNEWAVSFDQLWEEHIQPMLNNFGDFCGSVADLLKALWENVLKPLIDWIIENIFPIVSVILNNVVNFMMKKAAVIYEIVGGTIKVFKSIIDFLRIVFTGDWAHAWDGIVNIFKSVGDAIKGIVNSILAMIQFLANGVIDGINTVIRALNSLHVDVPDWVTDLTGITDFGFNIGEIQKVNIPKLATGAVLRGGNPFMAILNEQPRGQTNIEAPLSTIKQAVREELSGMDIGNKESIPVTINLNYDGETFARLSISDILSELGRQGYDVDVLGVT